MVQELVIYPDERILTPCTDVRVFNDKLLDVLKDMKDTMEANNLSALSSIQIAFPYNIIVIKENNKFKEYINPRILKAEGKIEVKETTSYYPNIEVAIPRYKTVNIVYEDKNGNVHYEEIRNINKSSIMQRKIDYLFGGTFLSKVSKNTSDHIIKTLTKGGLVQSGEICPLFSKKDYFVSFADKVLFFMVMALLLTAIKYTNLKLWINIGFISVVLSMIGFLFYAQYEVKKYKQCTSCQIGNNIGIIIKRVALGLVVFVISKFF